MYQAFLIILVIGCVLMFANLVYATTQKPSSMQIHIIIMLVCILLMFMGYYIELRATTMEIALLGTLVAYIGKPFIMFHGLMVVCTFYGYKVRKGVYYAASILGALIFLCVFTNPLTGLFYKNITFDTSGEHPLLIIENGPLYWIHAMTMFGYFIGCIAVSVKGYLKNKSRQYAVFTNYMVLIIIFGILSYMAYLTGLSEGYDSTILGIFAGVVCLSLLFYRYRIFDAISAAKDFALENSITGIIVIDNNRTVAYINRSGRQFLQDCFSVEKLLEQAEDEKNYYINDHTYAISRKEIENKGSYVCTSFEINDITVSVSYQARLEREVRERTEKIESIQRRSIAALASIVEARSLETGRHIARTSKFSRMIAQKLKELDKYRDIFTDEYIDLLADATSLHDIGKVSVPDNILLKPGRLTEEEFEEMKKHSEAGATIIEKAMRDVEEDRYVDLAVRVALYHHERWDGTGYPAKLKGEDIPIEARIMAVSDCFDALSAKRCYKEAFPIEKCIAIIKEESGTHFDPEVVDAFLKAYAEKSNLSLE